MNGLIADIQSPDYETRMAIFRKKEELDGLKIDEEVLRYIATNIKSNIRELEGALTKIVAFSRLKKRELNLLLAEEALQDIISPNEKKVITVDLISRSSMQNIIILVLQKYIQRTRVEISHIPDK